MKEPPVLIQDFSQMRAVVLNRPHSINTLNLEMIRLLRRALDEALTDAAIRFVCFKGAGDRGFCAGGDLKELGRAVETGAPDRARQFFRVEYDLDLLIHQFPKPVIVLADGITMGGGLGLAAGADLVAATERTRMALPETRIGFFPDVGATGWLFTKCPPGYPEYLALTGYELADGECVRAGLATHLINSRNLPHLQDLLENPPEALASQKAAALEQLRGWLESLSEAAIPADPGLDGWIAEHFAGKNSIQEILASLSQCSLEAQQCEEVFHRLSQRSPTALALTLKLLRADEGRPLEEVFQREARAAAFLISHPDYLEGIRARIIDKDDRPRWRPASLEEVALPEDFD